MMAAAAAVAPAAAAPAAADPEPGAGSAVIAPPNPAAARLAEALERYRAIEASGGWRYIPTTGPVLEVGAIDRRVAALRERLAIEGDLPLTERDGQIFDRSLADAVRTFQRRHGLDPDARVGLRTLAALNVPAESRVRQIAANLERWRDMPAELPGSRLEVNIPAAELAVFNDDFPLMTMRVVVGSRRFPTPTLQSRISSVVFNPPWTIPTRIARNEIVPRLKREPTYLRDNDIRILDRSDDPYGETIDWRARGAPRDPPLQQQPGPKNALGRIKFNFANGFSVYLHDTPGKSAFERDDRALSHGCVRLQRPEDLARHVLRAKLADDPDLVDRALASPETREVLVGNPLPIFIVYWTAFVDQAGRVNFRNDLYGLDWRLLQRSGMVMAAGEPPFPMASGCAASG